MRNKYLDFITEIIKSKDGKLRPRLRNPESWRKIIDVNLSGSFLDIEAEIKKDRKIWIWSDHHFYHQNVIKYSERPFDSVEEMNNHFIQTYNDTVGDDDICIFAGDVTFKSTSLFLKDILPKIKKGYKVLVIGNHDIDKKKVRKLNFDETVLVLDFKYNGHTVVVSHIPFFIQNENFINVHGHIHNYKSEHNHQINVSVEAINYKPVLITDLLDFYIENNV